MQILKKKKSYRELLDLQKMIYQDKTLILGLGADGSDRSDQLEKRSCLI